VVGRLLANRTASPFSGVAGMPRNQGLASFGITGCFASEGPAGIRRNTHCGLSRDSWLGQRKVHALSIEFSDCPMDRAVECDWVGEGLMREMMRFEIPPDAFDVVQFGGIFR
jgi:hypothetical protein